MLPLTLPLAADLAGHLGGEVHTLLPGHHGALLLGDIPAVHHRHIAAPGQAALTGDTGLLHRGPDVLRKMVLQIVNSCHSFSVSFSPRGEDKTYSCCSIWLPAPCVRSPRWSWSRTLVCRRSCTASPAPCDTPPCSQSAAPSCATAGNEGP